MPQIHNILGSEFRKYASQLYFAKLLTESVLVNSESLPAKKWNFLRIENTSKIFVS